MTEQETFHVFARALHTTNEWLHDVMAELETEDRDRAYSALRAVLHALRNRVTVDEAANLGAQLPLFIRGVYYEGWQPAKTPLRERRREQFLGHIREQAPNEDPEAAARAVFSVVAGYVTAGEIDDIVGMLPEGVRELWPA